MKQTYLIRNFGKITFVPLLLVIYLIFYLTYTFEAKTFFYCVVPTFKGSNFNLFIIFITLFSFFGIVLFFYHKKPKIVLSLFVFFIYFLFWVVRSYFEELHEENIDFYINNPDYPEWSLSDFMAAGSLMWLIITPPQMVVFFLICVLFDKLKNKYYNKSILSNN